MTKILLFKLLVAIATVESNMDDAAINEKESAHGRFQIRRLYLMDANIIMGTEWTLEDMHNTDKAISTLKAYTKYWCKRRGLKWNPENIARMHNGGCNLYKSEGAGRYWEKVKKIMEQKGAIK